MTFEKLSRYLWGAADILRKSLNASENSKPVLILLFLKRLNDVFEENAQEKIKKGISKTEAYKNPRRHAFFIPEDARWTELKNTTQNIGAKIIQTCKIIELVNPNLAGTMGYAEFNIKEKFPDDSLQRLVSHFSIPLGNNDLENEDVFGDAYEYILEKFADETKKKGGQFFTPRQVVRLLVELVKPQEGQRISDPTCGSGGMLIHVRKYVKTNGGNERNLTLEGQDSNIDTVNMCKMNMVLHGLTDFNIEWGDSLQNPKLVEGGQLKKYHKVLANFPFSENWDNSNAAKDPYNRFRFGIPPAKDKADFAFIQHMFASLNEEGQLAVICSQGVLFRGGVEAKIRENMIKEKENIIEAVIALPSALFYGTSIPGCILVLNKKRKDKQKNKTLFIYAAKDYQANKVRNKLRESDIKKISQAFEKYKDIDGYCHVADFEELKENDFNLNVPRYVDISEPVSPVVIQNVINELKKLTKERENIHNKVRKDLKKLGFKI